MTDITIKPDWLSWTVYPVKPEGYQLNDLFRADWFNQTYGKFGLIAITKTTGAGRKPYTRQHALQDNMGKLFANPKLDYCTVELTGRGCTMVMHDDGFEMIAEQALETCTRFDVAIDFKTDVTPIEFYNAGVSDRIKARSVITSEDGETVYVGSPKSDIYCRIYKYNPPHERAGLLRIEFVARRKRAKCVLRYWLENGPIFAVASMAGAFAFKHHLWTAGAWHGAVVSSTIESIRSVQKTRKWLLKQVRPALQKLAASEELTGPFMSEFLEGLPFVEIDYQANNMFVRETRVLPINDVDGTELPIAGIL